MEPRRGDFHGSVLIVAFLLANVAGTSQAQHRLADYQEVARRAFREGLVEYHAPTFTVGNGTVLFDPGEIFYHSLANHGTLYVHFMQEVLEVENIRHSFQNYGRGGMNPNFWEPTLRYIDSLIPDRH